MSAFDEATAALESRDWSSAETDDKPRKAIMVQSVRMPRELTENLFAEAQQRGMAPADLIRDLVEVGLPGR